MGGGVIFYTHIHERFDYDVLNLDSLSKSLLINILGSTSYINFTSLNCPWLFYLDLVSVSILN